MEVALHELGESIAATVASVQRELARYPNALGAFVLDEMDLTIPVRMRVDLLGQVRATVADEDQAGVLVGNLHLRLKPVLGAAQPPPVTSGQSLQSLNVLRPEVIARLEQERIFTVDDLLRVSNTATGRTALNKMQLGTDLSSVLDRASVLTLPSVPAPVAENLVDIGISKPSDFVQGDPVQIAHTLSERLKQPITPEAVQAWQKEVGDLISVPLPRPRPDMEQ
jgi:hypothetical protein